MKSLYSASNTNYSVIINAQADAAPMGRHFGNTGSGSNWHWSTVTAKEYLHLLVTTKQNILTSLLLG